MSDLALERSFEMKSPQVVNKATNTQYHLEGNWTREKFEQLQGENNGFVIVITNGGSRKRLTIRELRWDDD